MAGSTMIDTVLRRHYTEGLKEGQTVFDLFEWKKVSVEIKDGKAGRSVFKMDDVEVPIDWSNNAAQIAASKYFRKAGVPVEGGRETSMRQVAHRLALGWKSHGLANGYFTDETAAIFYDEIVYMLLAQIAAPNSPQWFNTGLAEAYGITGNATGSHWIPDHKTGEAQPTQDAYSRPQVMACFIQSVQDWMLEKGGIYDLVKSEAALFKFGSGTGSNFSNLRARNEKLSGGGRSSGLMSWLRILDASAGAVKSGGTCLAPTTMVYTDAGPVPVKTLADRGSRFVCLSHDPKKNRYVAKWATAFKSGKKKVVRVTTDKGHFDLTSDHPVRLSTGEYVEAGALRKGASLFSCTIDETAGGYLRIGLRDGMKGKALLHRLIASDILGRVVDNLAVHHVDGDPHNNSVKNLKIIEHADHASLHSRDQVLRGTHVFQTTYFGKSGEENPMHRSSDFWKSDKAEQYRNLQGEILRESGRARTMQEKAATQRMLNVGFKLLNAGYEIDTYEQYLTARKAVLGDLGVSHAKQLKKFENRFGSYAGFRKELAANNHRVTSVTEVGVMGIYDVEVECDSPDDLTPESGHNFVIWPTGAKTGSGVCVHNTRRSAKMAILNMDHPDIEMFIGLKAREELKVRALAYGAERWNNDDQAFAKKIGLDLNTHFNGEAYETVNGQNANYSVRITDEFMSKIGKNQNWELKNRTDGQVAKTVKVDDLWNQLNECAWRCADPGVQFDDTMQAWHTCPNSGRINATNPCCFVGETLVDTADGLLRFDELHRRNEIGNDLPYAFAFDTVTNLPVLRKIKKVWIAGRTKRLMEVKTDKGIVVRCTPEHRFLLRDGTYVEAQNLKAGMRLRKIGRADFPESRQSRRQIRHRVTESIPNGCVYQARFMWEQIHGPIPDGMQVHHINGDATDDRIDNLELISLGEHQKMHSSGESNPNYIQVDDALLLETWEAIENTPRIRGKNTRSNDVTPARWNSHVEKNGLKGKIPLANSVRGIRGMSWADFSAWIEEKKSEVNDRVYSVKKIVLNKPVAVYDMEVEGTHNFAVTNDEDTSRHTLVVHNSEYVFLDDTACNLASINLTKFYTPGKDYDVKSYKHAIAFWTVVLEISVAMASYPTKAIAERSWSHRPLGLGYANLGALLMRQGLAYDSRKGRTLAAALTAILTGEAYWVSALLAQQQGAFAAFDENREPMLKVIQKHDSYADLLYETDPNYLTNQAQVSWNHAYAAGREFGYRNSQISVIAPTGTISFVMDCDTTGIEPDFSLVKYKDLAGGGSMSIVNQSVAPGLRALNYTELEIESILKHIEEKNSVVGAPAMREEDYAVFDCAMGERSVSADGHLQMMAVCQPFLSGAISKTVNLPASASVEEVANINYQAWKLGIKCVALYRDGCKMSQPLNTENQEKPREVFKIDLSALDAEAATKAIAESGRTLGAAEHRTLVPEALGAVRRKLPDNCSSKRHKFSVGEFEGYIHAGMYPDGKLGEIFVRMSKQGSTMGGLLDAFATCASMALQYGVPVETIVKKFAFQKFEPAGITGDRDIPFAQSIIDYIARWIGMEFIPGFREANSPSYRPASPEAAEMAPAGTWISGAAMAAPAAVSEPVGAEQVAHARGILNTPGNDVPCSNCNSTMQRSGTCLTCPTCGSNTGCGG